MRTACWAGVVVVVLLAVVFGTAPGQQRADARKGLLAPLVVGNRILLKETPGGYTIRVTPALDEGPRVVEVGPDYLVVEDLLGTTQTRIPIYAIRSVTIVRVDK